MACPRAYFGKPNNDINMELSMMFRKQTYKTVVSLKHIFTHTAGLFLCLCVMAGHGHAAQTERFVYSIQIASYQKRQLALNAVQTLKKKALGAFYRSQEITGKGVWYRVYIDTYASIAEAEKAAEQLQQQQVISDHYIRRIRDVEKKSSNIDLGKNKDARLNIQEITYSTGKEKNDRVSIKGNHYFWPSLTYSFQGSQPTLLVYIDSIDEIQKEISPDPVAGACIKNMALRISRDTQSLYLQVALKKAGSYTISQSFNRTENIFSFEVRAGNTDQKKSKGKNLAL
jgi:sporulation related protein